MPNMAPRDQAVRRALAIRGDLEIKAIDAEAQSGSARPDTHAVGLDAGFDELPPVMA